MKVGEHPKQSEVVEGCPCILPVSVMLTYERPGMLTKAVDSYMLTEPYASLTVYDDGSESQEKQDELSRIEKKGITVVRLKHSGFADSWESILKDVREKTADCVVMLEDDIIFARGWMNVLQRMQRGITKLGFRQGLTTCLMPHPVSPNDIVDLCGVDAYQSLAHSWQVNMLPMEALEEDWHVFEDALKGVRTTTMGHGLDRYYVGYLAHYRKRLSYVSTQSWVRHEGAESTVKSQGFANFDKKGYNLVSELVENNVDSPGPDGV